MDVFAIAASAALSFLSPAYELIAVENADFRDWSRAELSARIQEDVRLLPNYRCDGGQEFALFSLNTRPNPNRNSLRFRPHLDAPVLVYREGHWYDLAGEPVPSSGSNSFARATSAALARIERLPTGRNLLRELEASPYPLVIEKGRNSFAPSVEGMGRYSGLQRAQIMQTFFTLRAPDYPAFPLTGIGAGGSVLFDPESENSSIEADGKIRKIPPSIVLAHEMYHAYDSVRGLLDRRLVWSPEIQTAEVTEIRASYYENAIRREAGIQYKLYYGSLDPNGPGLLDPEGNPIWIPAPCLRE